MRAISPHPRYSLQLIEAPVKRGTDSSGTIVEYQDSKPVIAEFRQLGLLDWEQVAALEHFSFAGLANGVHPLSQVSAYDTEAEALRNNWDARYLYEVDKRLEHLAAMFPRSAWWSGSRRSRAPGRRMTSRAWRRSSPR